MSGARLTLFLSNLFSNSSVAKKGPGDYVLLIASANAAGPSATHEIVVQGMTAQLRVEYGDFSAALKKTSDALRQV